MFWNFCDYLVWNMCTPIDLWSSAMSSNLFWSSRCCLFGCISIWNFRNDSYINLFHEWLESFKISEFYEVFWHGRIPFDFLIDFHKWLHFSDFWSNIGNIFRSITWLVRTTEVVSELILSLIMPTNVLKILNCKGMS